MTLEFLDLESKDPEKFAAGLEIQPLKLVDLLRFLLGKKSRKSEWREVKGKSKPPQNLFQDIEY